MEMLIVTTSTVTVEDDANEGDCFERTSKTIFFKMRRQNVKSNHSCFFFVLSVSF